MADRTKALVEQINEWALQIEHDGSPSQVGPSAWDLRQVATALSECNNARFLDAGAIQSLKAERKLLLECVTRIANYQDPDDEGLQEDEDGTNSWGLSKGEAVEMAYENVIGDAIATLRSLPKQENDNDAHA